MAIKLPYQQTDLRQLNQYQQALNSALQPITANPIAGATILPNITLNAGSNNVPIGLQQPLVGWILVRLRGNATVWDSNDGNTNNQILVLNSTATVVVDICVF